MKFRAASALLLGLAVAAPSLATPSDDCRKAMHEKIDRLDALMRHGYSGERGERLRAKRKALTELRAQCDQQPDSWKRAPA